MKGINHGNHFNILFADSAPNITCPPDTVFRVSGSQSKRTNISYTVTAVDALDGALEPVCSDDSGVVNSSTQFAFGEFNLTCTAEDLGGNRATCSFMVTILGLYGIRPCRQEARGVFHLQKLCQHWPELAPFAWVGWDGQWTINETADMINNGERHMVFSNWLSRWPMVSRWHKLFCCHKWLQTSPKISMFKQWVLHGWR